MKRREVLITGLFAGAMSAAGATASKQRRTSSVSPQVHSRDGTRLFIREWGAGPPILFVHSWALDSRIWQRQFIDLSANGFRCIAFDRRGHGRSDAPASGYDLDTLADDLASVIDHLNLRSVVLVGHSMGGGEVIRYISRHGSSRVSKIILIASTTPFLTQTTDNPYGAPPEYFIAMRAEWTADFPKWVEQNKKPFFTEETSLETMDALARTMAEAYLPALIACNEAFTATDLRPDLDVIDRPTLVIHGDKDLSAPLEITGRRTAFGIKGSTLEIYQGGPHGLFVTHADRLNRDILAFSRR